MSRSDTIISPAQVFKGDQMGKAGKIFREILLANVHYSWDAKDALMRKFCCRSHEVASGNTHNFFFTARESDDIIGVVFGQHENGVATVEWVGVAPKSRRNGVGCQLIAAAATQARENECHKLITYTAQNDRFTNMFFKAVGLCNKAALSKHWWRVDVFYHEMML